MYLILFTVCLSVCLSKKKAKTHYNGMPENNNQEFDAAEAALGSINTTPSCEILEHPQL